MDTQAIRKWEFFYFSSEILFCKKLASNLSTQTIRMREVPNHNFRLNTDDHHWKLWKSINKKMHDPFQLSEMQKCAQKSISYNWRAPKSNFRDFCWPNALVFSESWKDMFLFFLTRSGLDSWANQKEFLQPVNLSMLISKMALSAFKPKIV